MKLKSVKFLICSQVRELSWSRIAGQISNEIYYQAFGQVYDKVREQLSLYRQILYEQ